RSAPRAPAAGLRHRDGLALPSARARRERASLAAPPLEDALRDLPARLARGAPHLHEHVPRLPARGARDDRVALGRLPLAERDPHGGRGGGLRDRRAPDDALAPSLRRE